MSADKQIFSLDHLLKYAGGNFLSQFNNTLDYLQSKNKILFVTTSNRYQIKDKPLDLPKSSQIAMLLSEKLGEKATIVDGAKLKIGKVTYVMAVAIGFLQLIGMYFTL